MKPLYSEIGHIVSDFVKLADEGIDPQEAEDWRSQTYQGIEEELQRDIEEDIRTQFETTDWTSSGGPYRRVLYTDELRDTIAGAEAFLRRFNEVAPDMEYLVSKGIGNDSFPVPVRASHVISFINEIGVDGILNGVAYEFAKLDSHGNFGRLLPLRSVVLHAKNIIRAKGHQLLSKDLTAGKPSIIDSIKYWRNNFGNEIESYIDSLHKNVDKVKNIEKALVPIVNMISFLQSKSYTVDDEGNKTILSIELPEHIDFRIGTNFFNSEDRLREIYHTLRSNAVEIVNYTRSKAGLKPLKRIKKKPKDFLPMSGLLERLSAYIIKTFRNRDDALSEILRVQSLLENVGDSLYFFFLYRSATQKDLIGWYREYIYKDDSGKVLRNFSEKWGKIERSHNEIWQLFGSTALSGIGKLIEQNGDYRNILKIVSAVADSLNIVHNFSSAIHNNPQLKEEILEVCREGKGGIFKYEIVPKYFNAKSALDRVEKDRENIEKADEVGLIDKEEFFAALDKVKNLRLINIERSDYDDIKKASTLFKSINNLEYIVKYEKRRQDKDPILFNLDEEFEFEDKKIEFKVLRDRDPLHFFIGLETNCCQSIGEPGHQAVVDSYINPHAGVIVMYVNGEIVAQSYFHYVPKATEEDLAKLEQKRLKKDIKRKRYLLLPIDHMELSVRTHNMLERLGFKTVGDLAQLTEEELYNRTASDVSRAGSLSRGSRKVVKEVQYDLRSHKLDLGITIENWPEDPTGLSEEEEERLIPTMAISGGGVSTQLPPLEAFDNGIILDNVEVNPQRMRSLAISQENLDELYAKYAKEIAEKMGLDYVRCGKDYNKLSKHRFEKGWLGRDPREIMSKKKYSDFEEHNHLDLLKYVPEGRVPDDDEYWADDAYASLQSIVNQFTKLAIS